MEIRSRHVSDTVDLVRLAALVHEHDNYPIFLPDGDHLRFLSLPEPHAAWVATEGDEIVGHVALNPSTSRPVMGLVDTPGDVSRPIFVTRLFVHPAQRRIGTARRLLDTARVAALDEGFTPFLDVVELPTTVAAIALYQHAGWEEIGRVPFELVGDEFVELVFRGPTSRL